MIRGFCTLLALVGIANAASAPETVPECAKKGVAYSEDGDTAKSLPNGAYLATSMQCQQSCKTMPDCTHFTWKEDSFPGGACYLFTELGKETVDEKAISGPKACVDGHQGKEATFLAPTLPPVAAAPLVVTLAPVVAKSEGATGMDVPKAKDEDLGAGPEASASGGGGNTMVYGLVGGIAGAIAVAGGAYYFMSGKKKNKAKKSKRAVGVEQAPMIEEAREPASTATTVTPGLGQYQNMMMYPMGQQAQMTPVPQFYHQVPAYQPTTSTTYAYQYPGVQVAAPTS